MRKVLQTLYVFSLLAAGGDLSAISRNYAREKCLAVGQESFCNISANVLLSLLVFLVCYHALSRLKELWRSNPKPAGEQDHGPMA